MIEDLIRIQETSDFDLDGYIELVAVEKNAASLDLSFHVCTGVEDEPVQLWKIASFEAREYQTVLGKQCDLFELLEEHVLIWAYTQPKLSLTFSQSNPELNVYHVVGKLYEKHFSLVDKWIPFDSCFNTYLPLEKLIASGHGKLAEGAENIIIAYQEVLNEFGIKSSYLSSTPKRWDDNQGWIDENGRAKVLFFGSSYVIASEFAAQRIMN